jgi:hypothetical protein
MFQFAAASFQPRHGRLFELIRQQNLQNRRRRLSEEPMTEVTADSLLRAAKASVMPAPGWQKTAL